MRTPGEKIESIRDENAGNFLLSLRVFSIVSDRLFVASEFPAEFYILMLSF
jgi:hypothetical protein